MVYISHTHSTTTFEKHVVFPISQFVLSIMAFTKKFFDPFTKRFIVYNDENKKWETEPVTKVNIEDLLYMMDYVKAEIQIESAIDSQFSDMNFNYEKNYKKKLHN